jgi:outer membrane lipoprotein-sorting protein
MKIRVVFKYMLIMLMAELLPAQDAQEILRRVDANILADAKIITAQMTVTGRRGKRTMTSKSWSQGLEKSFTEYIAPARDKGTKMLKLADELWTYSPQSDRVIRISGHLLRQSVMGSDLSYEDMMEDPHLGKTYKGTVIGEETLDGRACWILDLDAGDKDVAYAKRKIWVDRERFVILNEQRFARSGKLLKTTRVHELLQESGRWYPKRMTFKDELQQGDGTEFIIQEIEFNPEIPAHMFTRASLRK